MANALTAKDIREFTAYLGDCSDKQVRGVYEKERAADRAAYVVLVEIEAARRGISLAD